MPRTCTAWLVAFYLLYACGCSSNNYQAVCQISMAGSQGSGTLIAVENGMGLVLTCRHVAEEVGNQCTLNWLAADTVHQTKGEVIAVVSGKSFNGDLALIICEAPKGVNPVRIGHFDPDKGPFHAVGFRAGLMFEAVADVAIEVLDFEGGLIKFNSPLVQGMSGGALFDGYGRLVGVGVASDFTTLGYAADGIKLRDLVELYTK